MRAKGLGEANRNFWLGVYNGILVNGGEAFFHSGLVLAPFLAALGAPAWAIGLIPTIRIGGWFLPQLFKLPVYRRSSTVRVLSFAILTATVFAAGGRPGLIVVVTLLVLGVNAIAGGVGGVPFADVTAKVVPHYRLGTFWVLRNAIGGVLALMAGLVLSRVLDSGLPFPRDFGLVFLLGSSLPAPPRFASRCGPCCGVCPRSSGATTASGGTCGCVSWRWRRCWPSRSTPFTRSRTWARR